MSIRNLFQGTNKQYQDVNINELILPFGGPTIPDVGSDPTGSLNAKTGILRVNLIPVIAANASTSITLTFTGITDSSLILLTLDTLNENGYGNVNVSVTDVGTPDLDKFVIKFANGGTVATAIASVRINYFIILNS